MKRPDILDYRDCPKGEAREVYLDDLEKYIDYLEELVEQTKLKEVCTVHHLMKLNDGGLRCERCGKILKG